MNTINQYISDLRQLIKENGRDDNIYTDPFLYSLLNGARNMLIEQTFNKINHISEWEWQQFPVKLVKDKSHMIGCVTVGCDVLRSEYKLPRPLLTNLKSLVNVTTFDYHTIDFGTEQDVDLNKYNDFKSNRPVATIINDYLVIWNNLTLKMVLVSGVWENIVQWADIPQCDGNGEYEPTACFDIKSSPFKISETMKLPVYKLILDQLNISFKLNEDLTNDSNSEIRS